MSADALSDLILLLVCAAGAWVQWRNRPALAVALGLVGLAAFFGVMRFSAVPGTLGPHRFASLLAAVAAFPLLAAALRWPDGPLATRFTAVGRFVITVGGVGILLTMMGVDWWQMAVPGLAVLVIAWTMIQARGALGVAGVLVLIASFAIAATGKPDTLYLGVFNPTQAMHYTLATALALLALQGPLREVH